MMLEHGAEPDVGVTRPSRVLVRSRVLVSPATVPSRPVPGFSNDLSLLCTQPIPTALLEYTKLQLSCACCGGVAAVRLWPEHF